MFTCNYSHARDNLASLLELAVDENQPVEIQRRKGGAAVLVDKDAFERYRKGGSRPFPLKVSPCLGN